MNNLSVVENLSAYMYNIKNIPRLTSVEELVLAKRVFYDNDLDAAQKMILAHLRFVVYIAKQYKYYGLPLEDLIQEGNIGLMKAVQKFDPSKKIRLVSYSVYFIKGAIHEYVMRSWKIGKLGTSKSLRKLFYNLRKMKKTTGNSSESERKAIAEELNVSIEDVRIMEERMYARDVSFNTCDDEDGDDEVFSPEGFLHIDGDNPEDIFEHDEYQTFIKNKLMEAIDELSERDRDIILSRKFRDKPLTLEELSNRYGVSLERIRQLEANTIKKLKLVVEEF